ncbi:SCP2 domain-containing protein [Neisseria weixii]|uniref:SCP2 domain-containing protein n=1 Tax=Neisseria weixii TaxID=1853276 RepID=A0A3N4MQT2_9NEIS|nr:SCP2 domain-containing protein [Neisseria weixii]RPD86061.1 SCP2 domain-containing protein [Neisseria weixii]RPD86829.1 SCP2 domain-containing protein [Neisseria weixii]
MSALLPVINHLIQQNPEHQYDLAGFAGKTLSVQIAGFRIHGRISEKGFLEAASHAPDTEITFHNSAIQKILQGGQPGVGDIAIDGDLILGMSLLPILGGLRYYANDDLSRIFGDAAAGSIATRAAVIGHTVKQIGKSIAEQISEFSREPESPVIDQATLAAWMEEVDQLRDDVARLHARLDRLERDIRL